MKIDQRTCTDLTKAPVCDPDTYIHPEVLKKANAYVMNTYKPTQK